MKQFSRLRLKSPWQDNNLHLPNTKKKKTQKTQWVTAETSAVLEQTQTETRGYQETSETLLQAKKP
jgi:hypothetical protein